jgi:rubrerythrin
VSDSAAREAQRTKSQAEAAASAEEARAREARLQAKLQPLLAAGELIPAPKDDVIVCSNGHRYKYRDFQIESRYTETEYQTDWEAVRSRDGTHLGERRVERPYVYTGYDSRFGCPLCKSTLAHFQEERLNSYRACRKCGYWYRASECPLCAQP